MQERESGRRLILLGALALAFLLCAVFWPVLSFDFVDCDVYDQVLTNPHITGLNAENLKHIFTSPCLTSYYPVRTLSFLVDYQIWGLNPLGFKLTNLLIHLSNLLLFYWLVLRIFACADRDNRSSKKSWDIFVATFSAGLFAVHPVVVEPVVWVAGREELLMLLGALGCFHFHLAARQLSDCGDKRRRMLACYVGAAFCCAVACLSNAIGAVIPLIIVTWDFLTLPRPAFGRIVSGTAALWAIGLTTILIKKLTYTSELLDVEVAMFSAQRPLMILRVYWLNLKSLVWPTGLAIRYTWYVPETAYEAEVILGGLALGLTCLALWKLRHHKLVLFGLLWFGLALAPACQILPHHIHRADRFLYLPLVGLLLALALGLRPLGKALKGRAQVIGAVSTGLGCLLVLDILSAAQVQTWRNSFFLWQHAVSVTEDNTLAYSALAGNLAKLGLFEQAIPHYREALRIDPNNTQALNNYAVHLATSGDRELRDYELAVELAARCRRLERGEDPIHRHGRSRIFTSYADYLAARGEFRKAIGFYGQAINEDPNHGEPLLNLAAILAACPDQNFRRPENAIRLAQRACELAGKPSVRDLTVLATAYAAHGQSGSAIKTLEQAIQVARDSDNSGLVKELEGRLELYRSGKGWGPLTDLRADGEGNQRRPITRQNASSPMKK